MPNNKVTGPGGYNAICDVCGLKYKAAELTRRWDGAMVCKADYEPRHPQEFVRAKRDEKKLAFIRPDIDNSLSFAGTPSFVNAIGNATFNATYTSLDDSFTNDVVITVVIHLTLGSTTTINVGAWTVPMPIANGNQAATGHVELIAKNKQYRGNVNLAATASSATVTDFETGAEWTDVIPQTLSEGDRLLITIRYGLS